MGGSIDDREVHDDGTVAAGDEPCAAAEIILAIESLALGEAEHGTVATGTTLTCLPGALNVIPGEVGLLVDVRGLEAASMNRLVDQAATHGREIEARTTIADEDLDALV